MTLEGALPKPLKLDWIDLLRGVAILMVIAVHVSQRVPRMVDQAWGQLGVQLFFVTSAVTLCLSSRSRSGEPNPLLRFYARRFFRIAPLYCVGVLIYTALSVLVSVNNGYGWNLLPDYRNPINILLNLTLLHAFYPPANNTIVPGGWSIATEVLFYAIFPALLWTMQRLGPVWRWVAAAPAVIACGLLLPLDTSTGTLVNNSFVYFSLLNQLPVFLVGMLAYYQLAGSTSRVVLYATALVSATLVAILWNSGLPHAFFFIPLLAALTFSCALVLLSRKTWKVPPFLAAIGTRSYSMYVLHFVLVWVVSLVFRQNWLWMPVLLKFALEFLIVAFVAYWVSGFTEKMIEQRGIAFGRAVIARISPPPATSDRTFSLRRNRCCGDARQDPTRATLRPRPIADSARFVTRTNFCPLASGRSG